MRCLGGTRTVGPLVRSSPNASCPLSRRTWFFPLGGGFKVEGVDIVLDVFGATVDWGYSTQSRERKENVVIRCQMSEVLRCNLESESEGLRKGENF